MRSQLLQSNNLFHELVFTTSRSGGPGGQNVNKVNSKVTVRWDVAHSQIATDDQKGVILKKLSNRLTKEGVLMLTSQEKRSQLQNKQEVLGKFDKLLAQVFAQKKVRKKSRPTRAAKRKRVEDKKRKSEKKEWRRKL